jgi:hypothetical protein
VHRRRAATRSVRDLVHAHVGRPAVCLGGGLSLPAQLEQCPPRGEAVYISANDHGARLTPCDYIVAHDKIEDRVRPFGLPLISRQLWADYRVLDWPAANSGIIAAWAARLMGCAPIYIVGMDCFAPGVQTYHDKDDPKSGGYAMPQSWHVSRWFKYFGGYHGPYRTFGTLADVVLPQQRTAGPIAREQIVSELRGVWVLLLQPQPIKDFEYPAGPIELPPREAQRMLKQNRARAYTPADAYPRAQEQQQCLPKQSPATAQV